MSFSFPLFGDYAANHLINTKNNIDDNDRFPFLYGEDKRDGIVRVGKMISKKALSVFLHLRDPSHLRYRGRLEFLAPLAIYPAEARVKMSLYLPS